MGKQGTAMRYEDTETQVKTGPRTGLWRYCTKYAKAGNAAKKRAQHLKNVEARRMNKGRKP